MTFSDYLIWQPKYSQYNKLVYADNRMPDMVGPIGIASEAGELLGIVQKAIRKDVSIDREKVVDELGDVMWYIAQTMNDYDISEEELFKYNKRKLDERNK